MPRYLIRANDQGELEAVEALGTTIGEVRSFSVAQSLGSKDLQVGGHAGVLSQTTQEGRLQKITSERVWIVCAFILCVLPQHSSESL